MYVKKKSHKFFRFFGGVHAIASFKVTDWQLMYQTCFPVCGCMHLHWSAQNLFPSVVDVQTCICLSQSHILMNCHSQHSVLQIHENYLLFF